MTTAQCQHGRHQDRCYPCRQATSPDTPARGASHGGESKQECLTHLCSLLDLPAMSVGVGSSLPSELFDALAARFAVPDGSMPEVAEA